MASNAEKLQIIPAANEKACIKLLEKAYKQNLTDQVIAVIKNVRSKERKCHNEGLLVDLDLIPNSQIITFTDEKGLKWCFEREIIPELLKTGQNPWTKQLLPTEFLETLKKAEVVPALPLDDAMKEVFGEMKEVQTYEKSKMIDEIDKILAKGLGPGSEDPYVSVNSFLEKERKFKLLPWNVVSEEEQIQYLYNLRNTMVPIAGNPVSVAYLLVKYADNAVILEESDINVEGKTIAKEYNTLFKPLLKAQLNFDTVINSMMSQIIDVSDAEMREIIKGYKLTDIPSDMRCGSPFLGVILDHDYMYLTLLIYALNADRADLADQLVRVGKLKSLRLIFLCRSLLKLPNLNWVEKKSRLFGQPILDYIIEQQISRFLNNTVDMNALASTLVTAKHLAQGVMKYITSHVAGPVPDLRPKLQPLFEKLEIDDEDYSRDLQRIANKIIKDGEQINFDSLLNNGVNLKIIIDGIKNPSLNLVRKAIEKNIATAQFLNNLKLDKITVTTFTTLFHLLPSETHTTFADPATVQNSLMLNTVILDNLKKMSRIEPFLKNMLDYNDIRNFTKKPDIAESYYKLAQKFPKFKTYLKNNIPGADKNFKSWTLTMYKNFFFGGSLFGGGLNTSYKFYLKTILAKVDEKGAKSLFEVFYTEQPAFKVIWEMFKESKLTNFNIKIAKKEPQTKRIHQNIIHNKPIIKKVLKGSVTYTK